MVDEDAGAHPRRGRRVARIVGIGLLVVLMVVGLAGVYAYRTLDTTLETDNYDDVFVEPRPEEVASSEAGKAIDVLIMGSDTREGDNGIDAESGGNASDTTILLHLSADRKRAYGVSIPRDALVERPDCRDPDTGDIIPGGTEVMWNEAFSKGGPGCTQSQFEQLSGIRVEYTVVVKFAGFKEMVDAVGGVDVCVSKYVHDPKTGITLTPGDHHLDGDDALDFVRIRKGFDEDGNLAFDGSDLGRIQRQQAFIASMAHEILSAKTLANPVRLYGVLKSVAKAVVITGPQEDIDLMDLARLGYEFRDIRPDRIQFLTIPWIYDPVDPNRVQLLPEGDDIWERLRWDRRLTSEQTREAQNAEDPTGSGSSTTDPDPTSTTDPSTTEPPTTGTTSPTTSASPTTPSSPGATTTPGVDRSQYGLCG